MHQLKTIRFGGTIRQKLIVAFLMIALVPLALLAWLNGRTTEIALTEAASQTLFAAASESKTTLELFLLTNINTTKTIAQLPPVIQYVGGTPEQRSNVGLLNDTFSTFQIFDPAVVMHVLLDKEGKILVNHPGDSRVGFTLGGNKSHEDYFQIPINSSQDYISDITFLSDGRPVLFFSSPVNNVASTPVGVVVRIYDATSLQTIITSNQNSVSEQSFVVLLDQNNVFLAHSHQPDLVFKLTTLLEEETMATLKANNHLPDLPEAQLSAQLPTLAQKLSTAATQPQFTITDITPDNKSHYAVVQHLTLKPWSIVFFLPQEVFLSPIQQQTRNTITLAIFIAGIIILLTAAITQILTSPIVRLTEVAHQVAEGDLTVKAQVVAHDEIGILGQTFNQMTTQLRNLIEDLQRQSTRLEDSNRQLEEMDKLKDEFLANTSHELRTPLNGIIGIAESLVEGVGGQVTEIQHKNLSMIISSGRRLSSLINDILDFSKLRHKDIALQCEPIYLPAIVDMILVLAKPLLGNKPVALVNNLAPDTPLIWGDNNRIQQILLNLVGNAIKFTQQGQIAISATLQGDKIALSVADTGIGIAPDKLSRIFQPFEQADGSIARQFGGTGIGLAITKQLIVLHGGDLNVTSTVNQGSTFSFTLPLATEQIVNTDNPHQDKDLPAERLYVAIINNDEDSLSTMMADNQTVNKLNSLFPDLEKAHILVVDDEPVNRQVLVNQLSLYNYQIITASDGPEALHLLQLADSLPDLIVLDVMMPQMSGYEVSRRIRQTYPATQLPIIMLTAKNRELDLVAGFEAGANDYLAKPFSKIELLARIKTHLQLTNLRELNATKDKFFSIIAHDLRAPFNPILNYSKMLMNSTLQQDQTKVARIAENIHRSTQNVYRLLENLLEWSRLQRSRISYNPDMLDLQLIAQRNIELLEPSVAEKDITLKNNVSSALFVYADIGMLNTIIRNLISNAIKFTSRGGEIMILSHPQGEVADFVEINISDTGIGVSQENLKKLFRLDVHHTTTGTAQEKGTGLGLIICQEMVQKHGGTIWVESELGKGTIVKFTLPGKP